MSWTIRVCPVCGYMDPDQHTWDEPRTCPFAIRGGRGGDGIRHPYHGDPAWKPDVAYVDVVVQPLHE